MKFLNKTLRRINPCRSKATRISPISINTTDFDFHSFGDDEILIHVEEFNYMASTRKELQTILDDNEKRSDFKKDCEKQMEQYPILQSECRRVCNKLNKILRNIWMHTRLWQNRLDTPQVLMQIVQSAVECRKQINITNEMIADFMDAIDFYNNKLLNGEKERINATREFEGEIKLLEDKLMMTIKEFTEVTLQRQAIDGDAKLINYEASDVANISHVFVSKTRYAKMCSYSKQLYEARTINEVLKMKDWEKCYITTRDINLDLRKTLALWNAKIDLANKIAVIVFTKRTFKSAKYAINYHIPVQEQPSLRSLEAIINESNNILDINISKRDEARVLKEEMKAEQLARELRLRELDFRLHIMRGRLGAVLKS